MKLGFALEICSGTYFPRRGRPQRGYYLLVDEIVVAGPFKTRRAALENQEQLVRANAEHVTAQQLQSRHLHPAYARTIASVLRKQEKTLSAAMGAAS
jgi:hypothetical protein